MALTSAFAITIETLFSIHQAVSPKQERLIFGSLGEAVPHMIQVIKSRRSGTTKMEMLLGTAATSMVSVLPPLIRESSNNIHISMQLADPTSNQIEYLPDHWVPTIEANLKRIEGEIHRIEPSKKIKLEMHTFLYTPWMNAFMLNGEHLYMTIYRWEEFEKNNKPKITLANCPYLYFKLTPENLYYFEMFYEWFDKAPQKVIGGTNLS